MGRLESRLQEVQAIPPQQERALTYGQAKAAARTAKNALDRQAQKVIYIQLSLEDEKLKLKTADLDFSRAEKVESEAWAK